MTKRLDLGKIPPQVISLEEAVLGAILLEKNALMKVIPFPKEEHFYKDSSQKSRCLFNWLFNPSLRPNRHPHGEKLRPKPRAHRASGQFWSKSGARPEADRKSSPVLKSCIPGTLTDRWARSSKNSSSHLRRAGRGR